MQHWWGGSDSAEKRSVPTTPAVAAEPAWRTLPPIQRVVTSTPAVAPLHTFASSLVTAQNPSFLATLGHSLDLAGPSGQVHGLAEPVPTTYAAADPLPLHIPAESPRRVSRMLAGPVAQRVLASPVAQRVLTSSAAQAATAIPMVSRVLDTVAAASPPAVPTVPTADLADSAVTPDGPEPLPDNSSFADVGRTGEPDPEPDAAVAEPAPATAATSAALQRTVAAEPTSLPTVMALPLLGEVSEPATVPPRAGTGLSTAQAPGPGPGAPAGPVSEAAPAWPTSATTSAPAGPRTPTEPAVQRFVDPAPMPTVIAAPSMPPAVSSTAPARPLFSPVDPEPVSPETALRPALAQRLSTGPELELGPTAASPAPSAQENWARGGPTDVNEATGPGPEQRPLLTEAAPLVEIDSGAAPSVRIGEPVAAPVQRAIQPPALVGLEHLLGGSDLTDRDTTASAPSRSMARARIGLPVVPSTVGPRSGTDTDRPVGPLATSIDRGVSPLPTASAGLLGAVAPLVVSRIVDPAGATESRPAGPTVPTLSRSAEPGALPTVSPTFPVSPIDEAGPSLPTLSRIIEVGASPSLTRAVESTLEAPVPVPFTDAARTEATGPALPSFPLASVPPAAPAAASRPLLTQRLIAPAPALAGAFHPAPAVPMSDFPTVPIPDASSFPARPAPMDPGPLGAGLLGAGPMVQRVADHAVAGAPRPSPTTVLRTNDAPTQAPLPSLSPVVPAGAYPVLSPTPISPSASTRPLPLAMPAPAPAPALAGDAAVQAGVAQRMTDNSVEFSPPSEYSTETASDAGVDPAVQRLADGPVVQTAPAGPAPGGGGEGALPTDLDELARRLFDPLSARLKTELWLDRERAGLISELRR